MIFTKAYAAPIDPAAVGLPDIRLASFSIIMVSNLIGFVGIAFFIYLLIGAIKYITAGGDKTAVQSAQHTITYALVGVIIAASAYGITLLLQNVFGISILNAEI